MTKNFASDNNSGVSIEILEALQGCNQGHVVGYGNDPWTQRAENLIRNAVRRPCQVFFVYGGTGANVVSLASCTASYGAIICAESAHINVDECGAPENFSGSKLLTIATVNGKISPRQIDQFLHQKGDQHHSQPMCVSISQPTELGTLYTLDELEVLGEFLRKNDLAFHMDGARIANAATKLGCSFAELAQRSGIDLLSFGATKNGIMFGEAIVSFNPIFSKKLIFLRKHGMQLHSKMRFLSAQFETYLETDLWEKNAEHANKMAEFLAQSIKMIPGLEIVYPVETNAVFVKMPVIHIKPLQDRHFFYVWDESEGIVRWMTSFDTSEEDIDLFVRDLKDIMREK